MSKYPPEWEHLNNSTNLQDARLITKELRHIKKCMGKMAARFYSANEHNAKDFACNHRNSLEEFERLKEAINELNEDWEIGTDADYAVSRIKHRLEFDSNNE